MEHNALGEDNGSNPQQSARVVTGTKIKAQVNIILTLSFEFPNNYSQKCVLWRNMPPPNRHGSPSKRNSDFKKKKPFGRPSESEPALRQVLAGVNQNKKGLPVFFVTSQSSSEENRPPSALAVPPPPPTPPSLSLISTPTRPRLSASQRLPCAPRRRKAGKNGQLNQHFHRRSSKAPCVCVCVRAVLLS